MGANNCVKSMADDRYILDGICSSCFPTVRFWTVFHLSGFNFRGSIEKNTSQIRTSLNTFYIQTHYIRGSSYSSKSYKSILRIRITSIYARYIRTYFGLPRLLTRNKIVSSPAGLRKVSHKLFFLAVMEFGPD